LKTRAELAMEREKCGTTNSVGRPITLQDRERKKEKKKCGRH
jgi:hypothetical protein